MTTPDPIDDYLGDLRHRVRLRRNAARLVEDAEEHLRSVQQTHIDAGLDPTSSAVEAIARFGEPRDIAAASPRAGGRLGLQIARAGMPFLAVGFVGVGVAGLMATVIASVAGADRIAALAAIQLALGFVGVSLIEARRRRIASGVDLSTPGITPTVVATTAAILSAALSAAWFVGATVLLLHDQHHDSTNAWLMALGLAAASIWIAIAPGARPSVRREAPAGG